MFVRREIHPGRLLVAALGIVAMFSAAQAGGPQVHFDTSPLVACGDVTTADFAARNASQRLVEARFTVSALLRQGTPDDLAELQFTFSNPEGTLHVVDFSPRTTLASDVLGTIQIENKNENSRAAGLKLGAEFEPVSAGLNLNDDRKTGSLVKYQKLPALSPVISAGTFDRERAVFLRLRANSQAALEGTHEFRLLLCVPNRWRGNYVLVRCAAAGRERGETVAAGGTTLLVALCQVGDSLAQAKARRLADTEQDLRRAAWQQREAIERAAYTNDLQRLARLFDAGQRKIPADWLTQVLYQRVGDDSGPWMHRLPSDVVAAAAAFTTAKLELRDLCGE